MIFSPKRLSPLRWNIALFLLSTSPFHRTSASPVEDEFLATSAELSSQDNSSNINVAALNSGIKNRFSSYNSGYKESSYSDVYSTYGGGPSDGYSTYVHKGKSASKAASGGGKSGKSGRNGGKLIEVYLEAVESKIEVGGQTLNMWTYNGQVPGPKIEGNVGDTLRVHYKNSLPEDETNVHWHGMEVPAVMDGSPLSQDPVKPGESFVYQFKLLNAATHWYHSHINTQEQIARGLYGPLIIRDPHADEQLPDEEYVLILDDILTDKMGHFLPFLNNLDDGTDDMQGVDCGTLTQAQCQAEYKAEQSLNARYGAHLLVNNALIPYMGHVKEGHPFRLRLINVANARFMRISIPNHKAWKIGGDGGLLEHPVRIKPINQVDGHSNWDLDLGLLLTPGERAEIVILPCGDGPVRLEWHDLKIGFHEVFYNTTSGTIKANHANPLDGVRPMEVLAEFTVKDEYAPPSGLRKIEVPHVTDPEPLEFSFAHGAADPDGNVPFSAQVIDGVKYGFDEITPDLAYKVKVGETRYLHVANPDGYWHNFHSHGFFFWHISTTTVYKDGTSVTVDVPYLELQDTIAMPFRPEVGGKTVLNLIMKFERPDGYHPDENKLICNEGKYFDPSIPRSGGWLWHCHMLEHAEYGMQTYIQVESPDCIYPKLPVPMKN